MKRIITIVILAIIISGLGFGWTAARKQPPLAKVTVVGSTALQPLTEAVTKEYRTVNPQTSITVQGGGSGTGLSQVQAGAVNIGASDIFAEQKDGINARRLRDHIVAVSGIVPIVNRQLGIKDLSMSQLRKIYTGEITNWCQVGGPNLPITVINRSAGSGTRVAFEQVVLKDQQPINAQEQDSNGTVKEIVASTPGAISYIATAYLNGQVQPLTIDGINASAANITTNRWPLWSYEHMYTRQAPSRATQEFIDFMQSKRVQQTLVEKAHYINIHDMQVQRTADGIIRLKE
ncbi:phosphate ABC transporter substrate-binding protein [Limosilactobacillus pontis]|uniref:Phosphate-binding protein n=1 Tax=Limosilactobacillus pontis TaxID=35787 RepID=A0A2J6NNX5_9LACO|nr:phosphate ABC transporter substrate-binding protein [Limosilactobacillus pontis]PMB83024.1 phosphate ABC transporter substrate-binding protein [Limosilactobacillus pontis]